MKEGATKEGDDSKPVHFATSRLREIFEESVTPSILHAYFRMPDLLTTFGAQITR